MKIYVSSKVTVKLDDYVDFLMRNCNYDIDEAETRRWEVEYKVNQHCNPILMKSGSTGTIKFKSVLKRQEISKYVNNRSQLMKIIKRRKGKRSNTQWNLDYVVSTGGDVFITEITCYNTFGESLIYQSTSHLINESIADDYLLDWEECGDYVDGIAWAYDGEFYGYIDEDGRKLTDFYFLYAGDFYNGLAFVEDDTHTSYYIDQNFDIVIHVRKFNQDWDIIGELFKCERAIIIEYNDKSKEKILYVIDTNGIFVTPPIYECDKYNPEIFYKDNGLLTIKKNNYIGLINIYGFILSI